VENKGIKFERGEFFLYGDYEAGEDFCNGFLLISMDHYVLTFLR
jgi:hypothetical protein